MSLFKLQHKLVIRSGNKRFEIPEVVSIKITEDQFNPVAKMEIQLPIYEDNKDLTVTTFKKNDIIETCQFWYLEAVKKKSDDVGYMVKDEKSIHNYDNFYITKVSENYPIKITALSILDKLKEIPFQGGFKKNRTTYQIINYSLKGRLAKELGIEIAYNNKTIDNYYEDKHGRKREEKHRDFQVHNKSIYEAFEMLSNKTGKAFFMKNGLFYFMSWEDYNKKQSWAKVYRHGQNIYSDHRLEYIEAEKDFFVRLYSPQKKGRRSAKPRKVEYPNEPTKNKSRKPSIHSIPDIKSLHEMAARAEKIYNEEKLDIFKGSFETIGTPNTSIGERIYVENPFKHEKNGKPKMQLCEMNKVETTYSATNKEIVKVIHVGKSWNKEWLKKEEKRLEKDKKKKKRRFRKRGSGVKRRRGGKRGRTRSRGKRRRKSRSSRTITTRSRVRKNGVSRRSSRTRRVRNVGK